MARVARRCWATRENDTSAVAAPVRPPGVTLDSPAMSLRRGHWVPAHVNGAPEVRRGESGQVRRTAAMHRRGGTGVPGRVPGGRPAADRGRRPRRPPPRRRCRSPSPTARPTSRPCAARDRRHRRRARRRDGRRRRRRRGRRHGRGRPRSRRAPRSGRRRPSWPTARATPLTATATNADDEEAKASSTFTTVTPTAVSTPSIGPLDGMTVGVGMPIRVYFDDPVADKAAVESHLLVTTSTPDRRRRGTGSATPRSTSGPRSTGRPTPQVTLDANLYGVNFGDGIWGEKNRSVSFTIGAKHVSIADAGTHMMHGLRRRPARADLPDERRQRGQPDPQRARTSSPSPEPRPSRWTPAPSALAVDAPGGYRRRRRVRRPHLQQRRVRARRPVVGRPAGQHATSRTAASTCRPSAPRGSSTSPSPGDVVEVRTPIGPTLICRRRRHLRLGHPVGPVAGRQRAEVTDR